MIERDRSVWAEFPHRLAAVRAFALLPEAAALAAANKRIANILKKSDSPGRRRSSAAALVEPAERALNEAWSASARSPDATWQAATTRERCASSPRCARRSMPSSTA